jgi:hypothetical protein
MMTLSTPLGMVPKFTVILLVVLLVPVMVTLGSGVPDKSTIAFVVTIPEYKKKRYA